MFWISLEKLLIKLYDYLKDRLSSKPIPSNTDLYLGEAQKLYYRDKNEKLFVSPQVRAKHLYLIGGTGMGKTSLIEHFIRQDVAQGQGFCVIEPHGDLCENLIRFLASLWARQDRKGKIEIARRTIIIEPFNLNAIISFNPLEVPENAPVYPCVLELMQVFKDKWEDMWGPRMAELLRSTLVVLAEKRLTLLEAPLFLTDTRFRNSLIENLESQEVRDYFIYRYNRLREWDKVKYREPVLNKISEFIFDKSIRYTIGQGNDSINFRQIIDNGKFVILNLSKGRLKINSLLLGGLFLAKLQLASLSRTDISFNQRRFFSLYVDEFQNFLAQDEAGDIETMLSESRKYALGLTLANQNISQLNQKLLGTILGNVGVLISFRLSRKDALIIGPEIDPDQKDKLTTDLINLKVGQVYLKIKGEPHRLAQLPYPQAVKIDSKTVEDFKNYSALFHSHSAQEIERQIRTRQERLGIRNPENNSRVSERENRPARERTDTEQEGQNDW